MAGPCSTDPAIPRYLSYRPNPLSSCRAQSIIGGKVLDAIRLFEELGTTVDPADQKQEADMDKFGEGNTCAKCGCDNAGFQFHEGMRANCELPEQTLDHMHRSCSKCGYEWAEVALDAS